METFIPKRNIVFFNPGKSGVLFIHPAKIDVEICSHCGGAVKVIACIEDQQVIDKILTHLKKKDRLPLPPDSKTHIWP